MKNALRIFKRDLKKVLTNWVALVVVIALIILPALYAWFNVKAMWDPYGNTRGIKIRPWRQTVSTNDGSAFPIP